VRQPALIPIADDNEANREILARRLYVYGYDIVMAADGEEALGNEGGLMAYFSKPAGSLRHEVIGNCVCGIYLAAPAQVCSWHSSPVAGLPARMSVGEGTAAVAR